MGSLRISEAFCVNERSTIPGLTSVIEEQWPVVCTCTTSVSTTTSLPQTAPKKRSERRDEATHAPAISTSSDTTPLLPASSARLA